MSDSVSSVPLALPDLLTAHQAATMLNLSDGAFYSAVRAGRLPAPIRISPRRCRWRRADIEAVIAGTWEA